MTSENTKKIQDNKKISESKARIEKTVSTSQTSQTPARTPTTSEALQLHGRRDQKTITVEESEMRVFKTFDTLIQSNVFKQTKNIGRG